MPATTGRPQSPAAAMPPIHILLSVQTIVIILLSVNRLTMLTSGYVAANQFLRWVDVNNMLILPLASVVAFYLLKKKLEYDTPARNGGRHQAVNVTFIIGLYLLAAGYGDHEVTNYLHHRFCPPTDTGDLCRIVIFNDNEFSHWLFFAGFILLNTAVMLTQVLFPARPPAKIDSILLMVNGMFIGLGIFANLAFEEIGLDLYVVLLLTLLSLGLVWRYGRQPLLTYYGTAYMLGLTATALVKGVMG